MAFQKGMYVINGYELMDDYYERALKDMYIITDEEDLALGLTDWLSAYSYRLNPTAAIDITKTEKGNYEIKLQVFDGSEKIDYQCFLISIPTAKALLVR